MNINITTVFKGLIWCNLLGTYSAKKNYYKENFRLLNKKNEEPFLQMWWVTERENQTPNREKPEGVMPQ